MTHSEFHTRLEALKLSIITATDHYLIIKDKFQYLKKEEKQNLNAWFNHSEKVVFEYKMSKPDEYIGILTDCLHEQMDEVVKAIEGLKLKALREQQDNGQ